MESEELFALSRQLRTLAEEAYDWRIGNAVIGLHWAQFSRLMYLAADIIEQYARELRQR